MGSAGTRALLHQYYIVKAFKDDHCHIQSAKAVRTRQSQMDIVTRSHTFCLSSENKEESERHCEPLIILVGYIRSAEAPRTGQSQIGNGAANIKKKKIITYTLQKWREIVKNEIDIHCPRMKQNHVRPVDDENKYSQFNIVHQMRLHTACRNSESDEELDQYPTRSIERDHIRSMENEQSI